MRFYAVGNQYLSSIQQGIQAFHCLGEMILDYGAVDLTLNDWLANHKTLICLNGGNNERLQSFYHFLVDENNPYLFTKFHEDEQSLGSIITCVGLIVPESIYNFKEDDPTTWDELTPWEIELATKLKKMPTAR